MKRRMYLGTATSLALVALALIQPGYAAALGAPEDPSQASSDSVAQLEEWLYADKVYKANCARCHRPPQNFSSGKMATMLLHMRVRANLTEKKYEALVGYLVERSGDK